MEYIKGNQYKVLKDGDNSTPEMGSVIKIDSFDGEWYKYTLISGKTGKKSQNRFSKDSDFALRNYLQSIEPIGLSYCLF